MIKRKCAKCEKVFCMYPSADRRGYIRNFCSRICYNKYKAMTKITWEQRKQQIYANRKVKPELYAEIARNSRIKNKTKYMHKNRVRALTKYYASKGMIPSKKECKRCGVIQKLEYHHNTYRVDDVEVYCRRCHWIIEGRNHNDI